MPRGHPSQGTNTIWRCLPILNLKQSVKPGLAVFWMDFVILFFSRGGSWIKIFVNVDEQVVATQIFLSFIPIWGRFPF